MSNHLVVPSLGLLSSAVENVSQLRNLICTLTSSVGEALDLHYFGALLLPDGNMSLFSGLPSGSEQADWALRAYSLKVLMSVVRMNHIANVASQKNQKQ